jgi:hypothetical protein
MEILWENNGVILCGEKGAEKLYKKLGPFDVIKKGAVHSVTKGYCNHIHGGDTIGDTPSSFSSDRVFYNEITKED